MSHVLADQENIHRAQVELVEEWKSREPFFGGMHSSVKLQVANVSNLYRIYAQECH